MSLGESLVLDRDCSIRQRMAWWSGGAYPVEGLLVAAVAEGVFSQCLYRHDERCKSPAVPNLTSDLSIQRGLYKRMKPHVDWALLAGGERKAGAISCAYSVRPLSCMPRCGYAEAPTAYTEVGGLHLCPQAQSDSIYNVYA